MNKKRILAIVLAVAVACGGVVGVSAAVRRTTSGSNKVIVVPASELNYGYGFWNSESLQGYVTSDRTQNVTLSSTQSVNEIKVQEGQQVKKGDVLLVYDMQQTTINLEKEKLNREKIELSIESAEDTLAKLKRTTPVSESSGEDPGSLEPDEFGGDQEDEEEQDLPVYQELTAESVPFFDTYEDAEPAGSEGNPYRFLCEPGTTVQPGFLEAVKKLAGEDGSCYFVLEIREGGKKSGKLIRAWKQNAADIAAVENDWIGVIDPDSAVPIIPTNTYADLKAQAEELEKQTEETEKKLQELEKKTEDLEKEKKELEEKLKAGEDANTQKTIDELNQQIEQLKQENESLNQKNQELLEQIDGAAGDSSQIDDLKKKIAELEGKNAELEGENANLQSRITDLEKQLEESQNSQSSSGNSSEGKASAEPTSVIIPATDTSAAKLHAQTADLAYADDKAGQKIVRRQTAELAVVRSVAAPTAVLTANSGADGEGDTANNNSPSNSSRLSTYDPEVGYTREELKDAIKQQEASIRDLNLDLRESDIKIAAAEKAVEEGSVKSLLDGVVTTVGDPETAAIDGSPLIQVSGSAGFAIRGGLTENLLSSVKPGDQISVASWSNGIQYTATISEISPYPDTSGAFNSGSYNTSYYPFTAIVDDEHADLQDHDWIQISVDANTLANDTNAFYLEKAFILEEGNAAYVYLRGEDGLLKKQTVQLGKLTGDSYEIRSGVTAQDWVAFPYGKNVKEGAQTREGSFEELYNM